MQYKPIRPQDRPYWWLDSTPWKTPAPANIELSTSSSKQGPNPLECDNLDDDCQPSQYQAESTNNEIDYEFASVPWTPASLSTNAPFTISSTTTAVAASTTEFTTSRTTTQKQGNLFSAADPDGPDEPEEDEDDENMYCGVDARHKIFDLKLQDGAMTTSTDFAEYPWVLYVYHKEGSLVSNLCAATLLEADIAITAAHCVNDYRNKQVFVRAGEWDLESEYEEEESIEHQDRRIKNIITHRNFSESKMLNDIAILHLDRPFLRKNNIRNICLPTKDDTFISQCIGAGWGNTGSFVNPLEQRYMRQSHILKIGRRDCESELRKTGKGPRFRLRNTQMCGRNLDGGGTCVGGCGGGLFCQTSEKPYRFALLGVRSWGRCSDGKLGVYTNVYQFKEWIMDTMDDIKEIQSS